MCRVRRAAGRRPDRAGRRERSVLRAGHMVAPNPAPPRPATPVPPSSRSTVVPIRPKPPAFVAPVIIEEDIVDYLVRASVEQRWRILSRVALATAGEPAPESALDACRPTVVPPAPAPGAAAAAAPAPAPDRASATPPPLPTS